MIIYSTLFLFNNPNFCAHRQIFIQLVRFLFNNFCCPLGQRTNKVTKKWRRWWPPRRLCWRTYFPPLITCLWRRKSKIKILILGFHKEARTSPLQTRNGSICPACNTWYRTGFRQERWSSLRWAVWFDYRHIPIPGSKSKPNETKDCKFARFWIVRDDSFRKPRKSVED